jgi:hypothetical protein
MKGFSSLVGLAPPLECAAGPKADQDQNPPGREGLDDTENIHASRGGEEGNFSLDIPFYRIAMHYKRAPLSLGE